MPPIVLFTWNLHRKADAHDIAVRHLARVGAKNLFVACFQEVPADSLSALGRVGAQEALLEQGIAVVQTNELKSGLSLLYSTELSLIQSAPDCDGEFIAALFRLPSSKTYLRVVGVHAESRVRMHHPEDVSGARALLRHGINAIPFSGHHSAILGDFNSSARDREMRSWYCFYALAIGAMPLDQDSKKTRRGRDHSPYFVLLPQNADALGTCFFEDAGGRGPETFDFVAVDHASLQSATATITTELMGTPLWERETQRPTLSDHLPVEATIYIGG